MNYWFVATCFLVGVSASSTMGPIFVLTFNNSASRGFLKGFFTALGSSIGDGILMLLGFMGMLTIVEQSLTYHLTIDLVGSSLLFLFGLKLLFAKQEAIIRPPVTPNTLLLTAIKAFLSTTINPLTILFFMFAGSQLLPTAGGHLKPLDIMVGSLFTFAGSLAVLTIVALVATSVGKVIKPRHLQLVSQITGGIILAVGAYFMFDAMLVVYNTFFIN
jgi:threonine/homoserine/homoserine lactone efflux protein